MPAIFIKPTYHHQAESDSARRKRKRLELEAQHTAKLRDLLAQSLIGEGTAVRIKLICF